MNKQRLEAFSDGVFAIVITLLILDIKIPEALPAELGGALHRVIPQVLTYILSFFIVGLYWNLHHQVSTQIKRIDEPFTGLILFGYFLSVSCHFLRRCWGDTRCNQFP